MKATVINSSRYLSTREFGYFNEPVHLYHKPSINQDIMVYGDDIKFDIRMTSENGFYLPTDDSHIEVEIKFRVIPKPQYPIERIFK